MDASGPTGTYAGAEAPLLGGRFRLAAPPPDAGSEYDVPGEDTQRGGAPVRAHVLEMGAPDVETARERMARAVRATAGWEHPNVLAALALEEDAAGRLALVSEWAAGETLDRLLEGGPLPAEQAVAIAMDLCRAVEALYAHGVVHRDIKPAHVLVGQDGLARLTGLGIAQLAADATATVADGPHPGTPAYKSPEQRSTTGYLDQRSDLYAVALVLYEMVTGRPYVRDRLPPRAVSPDVPASLEAIILRGLEEDPAARYQTAAAMRADLQRVQEQRTWGQVGIVLRRVRLARLAAAGALLLLVLLVVGVWRLGSSVRGAGAPLTPGTPAPGALTVAPVTSASPSAPAGGADSDGFEPDDANPAPIEAGEIQIRSFAPEGDVDRAALRVRAGHAYTVFTGNLAEGVDTRLEVLVGGRSLANDDRAAGDVAAEVSFVAAADGVAVITVTNKGVFGPAALYALGVVERAPTPTSLPTPTPRPTLPLEPSRTPRPTLTPVGASTPTPRPTSTLFTSTPTRTLTPTLTRTPTMTRTLTLTPTLRMTSTPTDTPAPTDTPTPVRTPLPVRTPGPPTS